MTLVKEQIGVLLHDRLTLHEVAGEVVLTFYLVSHTEGIWRFHITVDRIVWTEKRWQNGSKYRDLNAGITSRPPMKSGYRHRFRWETADGLKGVQYGVLFMTMLPTCRTVPLLLAFWIYVNPVDPFLATMRTVGPKSSLLWSKLKAVHSIFLISKLFSHILDSWFSVVSLKLMRFLTLCLCCFRSPAIIALGLCSHLYGSLVHELGSVERNLSISKLFKMVSVAFCELGTIQYQHWNFSVLSGVRFSWEPNVWNENFVSGTKLCTSQYALTLFNL